MVQRKIRLSYVHLFYVILSFFLLHRLFFFSSGAAERTISYIAYPFIKVHSIVLYPFRVISLHCQTVSSLQQQLQDAKYLNNTLRAELIKQQSLQLFDQRSKDIIDFARRYESDNKTLANVLSKISNEKEDTLLIDIGAYKAVKKDDVVVFKNMLIGRIVEVYPWYSKVALITDRRCKVSAECKKDVSGICCGKNNQQLEFNFVPHYKDVKVGETLLSTGQGLIYPKGFALGVISHVDSDNLHHTIQVKPMLDLYDLEYVYVFHR